ncbi:HupE/UreJ family protein [Hirschia litorea]|uniref:HupE/UreJ family protein n=1 Tax=Hirschia litorea TaxID=1199156 RepID=A0ABW2IPL7_9PROT
MKHLIKLIVLAQILVGAPALAHTGGHHGGVSERIAFHDFMEGLQHPFGGMDHLLAIIAVGVICVPARKAHLGLNMSLLAGFAAVLALGFGVSSEGQNLAIEWVQFSFIVLFGMLILFHRYVPNWVSYIVVITFAFMHGQMMPEVATSFAIGLWLATTILMVTIAEIYRTTLTKLSMSSRAQLAKHLGQGFLVSAALIVWVQ